MAFLTEPIETFTQALDILKDPRTHLRWIFREVCSRETRGLDPGLKGSTSLLRKSETVTDAPGSSGKVSERRSETSTAVPSSRNVLEEVSELALEVANLCVTFGKDLHSNVRAGEFQCPGPFCGAAELICRPCDSFDCDVCGNRIPSEVSFWHCPRCDRGICPDCVSKSEVTVTVSQKLKDIQFAIECKRRGDLPKAELAFHRLLDSTSNPLTLLEITLKFELGCVKQKMNKLQEAETIFQEALVTAEALKGREKECSAILHQLGVVQRERKEWSEAEKYLRKSLEMRMVANAETHQIVKTVVELGRVLHETHGGDAALHFVQEVLGNCRMKVLPARLLSWTHHEIGRWCYSKGDINSAQSHFVEALSHDYSVCDGTFSDSDRDLSFAYTLHEMGLVAKSSRKVAAAMVCFTEALHRKIRAKCPDEQVKLTEEELGTLCMSEPSQPALHLTAREDAVQNSPPRQSLIKPKILYNVRPS